MPEDSQLDVRQTFESQRDLVNRTIIPTVQASLDQTTFPVDDNIIYDLIHERHRHRRESYLLGLKTAEDQDMQARRRHKNARAREVSDLISRLFITINLLFIVLYNYRKDCVELE
jgi:hypothetical protein